MYDERAFTEKKKISSEEGNVVATSKRTTVGVESCLEQKESCKESVGNKEENCGTRLVYKRKKVLKKEKQRH
jgi:hypothetical protein